MDACGRKKRTALTGVLLVLHSEPPPLGRPRSMGHPRRDTRRVPPRWWMLTIMMPSWGGGGCHKVASHAPCPRVGDDGKGGVLVGAPQRQREWQANSLRRMTAVSLPSSRIPPPLVPGQRRQRGRGRGSLSSGRPSLVPTGLVRMASRTSGVGHSECGGSSARRVRSLSLRDEITSTLHAQRRPRDWR